MTLSMTLLLTALVLICTAPAGSEEATQGGAPRLFAKDGESAGETQKTSCGTLAACIEALTVAAEPGPGISKKEGAVSDAVRAYGREAVPELLKLLRHGNWEVRALASYTLRDIEGIGEEHLDALIESRLRGDGWIPPAIARIGTRRAIEFLVADLRRDPQPHTQLTWAFEMLGEKGVPYLVDEYRCHSECDEAVLAAVTHIFSELGRRAASAVTPLLSIAEDQEGSRLGRTGAIRALGALGPLARSTPPRLQTIAASAPESFEDVVNRAIIDIGGPEADEALRAEAEALGRCQVESSPEATQAATALDELDRRVRGLTSAADLDSLVRDLHGLLRSRCFRLSAEQGPPPTFGHVRSLQDWWQEGGGAWLNSYIHRPKLGRVDDLRENVVFPPQPRRVLALDTAQTHPLLPLLCDLDDEACGKETQGWAGRARKAFAAHVLERLVRDSDAFPVNREAIAARCETEVRDVATGTQYTKWMNCLKEHRPVDWALPLGRFQSPRAGWLIIRGRRGHYEFCDEVRAYDLETGAAYVAQSCSALHLQPGGSVDFDSTNAAREVATSAGRVNIANLREAAWMMLLAPEAERTFLSADYFPIPRGVTPSLPEGDVEQWIVGGGFGWSSAQTLLSWSWRMSDSRTLASGDLTWPSSYSPVETHTARLLTVAEAGFEEGCTPAAPPALGAPGSGSGVSARDAWSQDLTALQRELADALRGLALSAACQPVPPE